MEKSLRRLLLVLVTSYITLTYTDVLLAETELTDHQHSHSQDQHADSGLSLNQGEKWKTDAPLRQGMQSINEAAMNAVLAYHNQTLTKMDGEKLAKDINEQVNYLVANCKLEPAADATLHVLIGDLLTAAAEVNKDSLSRQGLPIIIKVLQLYPDYFDHQGWTIETGE